MTTEQDSAAHSKQYTIVVNGRPGHRLHHHLPARARQQARGDPGLVEGGTIKVKDGMIFNVTATNKS